MNYWLLYLSHTLISGSFSINFNTQPGKLIETLATNNSAKRSSDAEHLVNNIYCAKKYDLSRFKIIHHCTKVFDLWTLSLYF